MKAMTSGSRGFDVTAAGAGRIGPGDFAVVETTCRWKGVGRDALLLSRSGHATQGVGMVNGAGLIDADYEGTVKLTLYNLGGTAFEIKKGDRIGQIVFFSEPPASVQRTEEPRMGGLGSTGS